MNHQISTAKQMGWNRVANGDLLKAAERSGFDVPVTADKNLSYQQNIEDRKIAIIVLGTNHWETVRWTASY